MKKWIVSILILILLTGCTNQNPVQTTQENTTDIRTMDQTENESEEISASLLEESVTVEKLQADSEKNLAQMQKEQTVYTTQCINLYQEPSLESDVMAIIGSGDALKQIESTLSVACIINGETPSEDIRPTIFKFGFIYFGIICITVFFDNKNPTTQTALSICEIIVASAAPRTPILKVNMNIGSSMIFVTAPITTDNIAVLALPWQVM